MTQRIPMVRVSYPVEAGLLIRGDIRRTIERWLTKYNMPFTTRESKGLLESLYTFDVWGTEQDHRNFIGMLKILDRRYADD